MRARNEVTVDRIEFREAVGWTRRGKAGDKDATYLVFEEDGFTVVAPMATTKIKSVGRWEDQVSVSATALKRLASRLPIKKESKIQFFDGWLIVGDTKISATSSLMPKD